MDKAVQTRDHLQLDDLQDFWRTSIRGGPSSHASRRIHLAKNGAGW
jgi:hypothetical protein